jgi:hypothetical protein
MITSIEPKEKLTGKLEIPRQPMPACPTGVHREGRLGEWLAVARLTALGRSSLRSVAPRWLSMSNCLRQLWNCRYLTSSLLRNTMNISHTIFHNERRSDMKTIRYFIRFLLVLIILVLWMGVLAEPAPAAATGSNILPLTVAPVHSLLHVVKSENIDPTLSYVTYLDDPILNGTLGADYAVWATANWNPEGTSGVYNNRPIGVWYNPTLHRWAIVNQDGGAMVAGQAFNVMFDYANPNAFCHPTTLVNTSGSYSMMDFSIINGKPNEILIMTQYLGVGTTPGSLYNHNVGIAYDASGGRWRIYNEDATSMELSKSFCFLDVTGYQNSWMHIVHATGPNLNSYGNYTWLTSSPTHQRHALFFTTHFIGDLVYPIFSNHPLGVWYDSYDNGGSWSIFNQDLAAMVDLDYYFVFAIEKSIVYLPLIVR